MSSEHSFKLHNPIADGAIDQDEINRQAAAQDEYMEYVYTTQAQSEKFAQYNREIKKLEELRAAVREQGEYVKRLSDNLYGNNNTNKTENKEHPLGKKIGYAGHIDSFSPRRLVIYEHGTLWEDKDGNLFDKEGNPLPTEETAKKEPVKDTSKKSELIDGKWT
jgi:hypothetical protein